MRPLRYPFAGANGVCTYNYNGLRKKQKVVPFGTRWAEVCRVYGEFARHTDIFLSYVADIVQND
ncbi:MAG: hypothetical protein IKC80_08940 [Kiritimatiellae bacterium]|nr:hypothetical protein [Kiritimatiellia bacterium]